MHIKDSIFSELDYLFNDSAIYIRGSFKFVSYFHYIKASVILLYESSLPVVMERVDLK